MPGYGEIMAYIETLAPRDWSFCTLFGYPYTEGARNIALAFPCCSSDIGHEPPSLCERVLHLVVGLALIIPIINTIVFIALRFFQSQVIIQDRIDWIDFPEATTQRSSELDAFNAERNVVIQELTSSRCKEPRRSELIAQISQIEATAAARMQHEDTETVSEHQRMSLNKEWAMTQWDGVITYPLDEENLPYVHVVGGRATPSATFKQVGGLTQLKAENYMCGYYALFFMLNAATGQDIDHTNRDAFNTLLTEWQTIIATKRVTTWLATHRERDIPYGLIVPGHGISRDDMQYLITHCESLAPLREIEGCFMLEMDEFDASYLGMMPVQFLGKSKTEFDLHQKCPTKFPLYIILKEKDLHYYLFYARCPGEFTVVHSLNHSITNPDYFKLATFTKIIQALTGVKTPLRLEW